MGDLRWRTRSGRAWGLARRQHGVLTHSQLVELGFTPKAIEHRVATGRLHPVWRGVYAVGRPQLPRQGEWTAALLSYGDEAFLSHRSAAALYGIGKERGAIEVSVRRPNARRHQRIRVRRRPALPRRDLGTYDRVPVTSPVRTLLDYATLEPANRVERAVNEADKHDLIDPEQLRRALERYAGEPGARLLRRILDKDTFLLSDDELELLFQPLAREAGLPLPEAKVELNDFEVDFFWPALGLVVKDRRLALSPHPIRPDAGRPALSPAHRLGPHPAALLPLAGQARPRPRGGDPPRDGVPPRRRATSGP